MSTPSRRCRWLPPSTEVCRELGLPTDLISLREATEMAGFGDGRTFLKFAKKSKRSLIMFDYHGTTYVSRAGLMATIASNMVARKA